VPVEEVEKTETKAVEETTTEEIIICDSCGMNDDSESNLFKFSSRGIENNLYFCKDCLEKENKEATTGDIDVPYTSSMDNKETTILSVSMAVTVFILGFLSSGILGIISGLVIFLLSMLVSGIIYEILIE